MGFQFLAAIGHGMRTDRHAGAVEIGNEPFFGSHHVERGRLVLRFRCFSSNGPVRCAARSTCQSASRRCV